MIIIEIKFGPINGNPMSVDKVLSTTSSNPVENRVITQELENIKADLHDVQDGLEDKEVVTYTTEAELRTFIDTTIDEGTDGEITAAAAKLYYVTETNKLYKFDGDELHQISNDEYIIVAGNETERDTALQDYKSNGSHKLIWITTETTSLPLRTTTITKVYTFSVESRSTKSGSLEITTIQQVLSNRDGWMQRSWTLGTWGEWTVNEYSYNGHTHTTDDIEESEDLNTKAKTLVEAINEVHGMAGLGRILAINFYDNEADYAQWHNLIGDIKVTAIQKTNIAFAYISDGSGLVKQNIETLLAQDGGIELQSGSPVTIEIMRQTEGFAALTLTFEKA